jgi:hypothetical protein
MVRFARGEVTSGEWRVPEYTVDDFMTMSPWFTLEHVWLPYMQMKEAGDL